MFSLIQLGNKGDVMLRSDQGEFAAVGNRESDTVASNAT
jgi:hypothetical protein